MYSTHIKVLGKATMTLGFDWFAKQSPGQKPDHTRPNLLFSSFFIVHAKHVPASFQTPSLVLASSTHA